MDNTNLQNKAKQIRRTVIDLLYKSQSCHLGSNMSCIDILVVLYYYIMNSDDTFISSKGWSAAAVYSILADTGVFPKDELYKYFTEHKLLSHEVPGVIFGTGSGGQGLSVAVGMALANKKSGKAGRVFCLMSDGEMQEGTTWEAAMFAAHHKLDNLVVIVDDNKLQAFGKTAEVVGLGSLKDKWGSFGWQTGSVYKGNDITSLDMAIRFTPKKEMPAVVVAHTLKGCGVPCAEGKMEWHYFNLNKEQYEEAIKINQS